MTLACPYCEQPAELVTGREIYPYRDDLASRHYWFCRPCQAWVGCHEPRHRNGAHVPLGRLANAELRAAKSAAHKAFDPIWKAGEMTRAGAYRWLAGELGVSARGLHMGGLDVAGCERVVAICKGRAG